jgi:hypothetical protein
MAYIPEDPDWNKKIQVWMDTVRYCTKCGMHYRVIDNIGSWRCRQRMYDPHNEKYVYIAADHGPPGEPFSESNNVVIAACAFPYLGKRVNPAAILKEAVVGKNARGVRQVFPAIKVRRYDRQAWERIRYGVRQVDEDNKT